MFREYAERLHDYAHRKLESLKGPSLTEPFANSLIKILSLLNSMRHILFPRLNYDLWSMKELM